MIEEINSLDPLDSYKFDNSYPFLNPRTDTYTSERMTPIYLTREDILDLGFLRTSPHKKIYRHTDKSTLYLEQLTERDFSVKDEVIERVQLFYYDYSFSRVKKILYSTDKPNKEDIQLIISNYAG